MDKHLPFLLIFLAAIDLLPIRQQAIHLNQCVEAEDDYFCNPSYAKKVSLCNGGLGM